jgi:hypothetical protein
MNGGRTKKGGRFEALIAAVEADGPLEVNVLASSVPRPGVSAQASRAAQHMVGAIASEGGRVGRVAALLDNLRAADAGTGASKRRHAS